MLALWLAAATTTLAAAPPSPATTLACPHCFNISVDWASGSPATSLPAPSFSVRKLEVIVYPGDGRTYGYADIVNFSDPYYPVSYSSEVGVFSSADGVTGWQYHGIVVPKGPAGSWHSAGIASPGAAVAADGTVLIGWCGENSPGGGINRGIGLSVAPHPLGPFTKQPTPVASPTGVCGGHGRCDDVIMQTRPDGVHLYHSVKGTDIPAGCDNRGTCIRHRVTKDGGRSWSQSTIAISRHGGMETFAGKWFPSLGGGQGAMVLITDGGPGGSLTPFISAQPGARAMDDFVPTSPPTMTTHPPITPADANPGVNATKGDWQLQMDFIPDKAGKVVGVSYSQFTGAKTPCSGHYGHAGAQCGVYTHTVYKLLAAL